jgi:hypothetical protein
MNRVGMNPHLAVARTLLRMALSKPDMFLVVQPSHDDAWTILAEKNAYWEACEWMVERSDSIQNMKIMPESEWAKAVVDHWEKNR